MSNPFASFIITLRAPRQEERTIGNFEYVFIYEFEPDRSLLVFEFFAKCHECNNSNSAQECPPRLMKMNLKIGNKIFKTSYGYVSAHSSVYLLVPPEESQQLPCSFEITVEDNNIRKQYFEIVQSKALYNFHLFLEGMIVYSMYHQKNPFHMEPMIELARSYELWGSQGNALGSLYESIKQTSVINLPKATRIFESLQIEVPSNDDSRGLLDEVQSYMANGAVSLDDPYIQVASVSVGASNIYADTVFVAYAQDDNSRVEFNNAEYQRAEFFDLIGKYDLYEVQENAPMPPFENLTLPSSRNSNSITDLMLDPTKALLPGSSKKFIAVERDCSLGVSGTAFFCTRNPNPISSIKFDENDRVFFEILQGHIVYIYRLFVLKGGFIRQYPILPLIEYDSAPNLNLSCENYRKWERRIVGLEQYEAYDIAIEIDPTDVGENELRNLGFTESFAKQK